MIMKRKNIKLFCLIFSFLCIVSLFPFSASAKVSIDSTNVMYDLERMKDFDMDDYNKDPDADYCSLIAFHEYGYDYNNLQNDYGLYVYIYNPSGKPLGGTGNKIQMTSENLFGHREDYKKYDLILVSFSADDGYEHVFYKFKVNVDSSFYTRLSWARRKYCISGIELREKTAINAKEHPIESTFAYTGFSPYHGKDRNSPEDSLECEVEALETVHLELHDASWKTATSDKGANHQYEISTVYFAVPNYFLEKYGSEEDLYKGLYALTCEWYEYKINGLVTNTPLLYDQALDFKGVDVGDGKGYDIPFTFKIHFPAEGDAAAYNYHEWIWDYVVGTVRPQDIILPLQCKYPLGNFRNIDRLHNVFYYSQSEFKGLSSAELKNEIFTDGEIINHFNFVDDGRKYGYNNYEFTVEDGRLNTQIASYASNHEVLWTWLQGNYKELWEDEGGYTEIKVFHKIVDSDLAGSDAEAAAKLFVSEADYRDIYDFYYESKNNDSTVYLLRFAVTDYVCGELTVCKEPKNSLDANPYLISGEHYYFEKTVFHNFDAIDITFRDEYGVKVTLPVASSPITIVGTVTPPTTQDGSASAKNTGGACNDWGFVDTLIFVIGVVSFFLIVVGVLKFVSWVMNLFPGKRKGGSSPTIVIKADSFSSNEEKKASKKSKKKESDTIEVDKRTGEVK